jgi:hypothetical protein
MLANIRADERARRDHFEPLRPRGFERAAREPMPLPESSCGTSACVKVITPGASL